ncbi:tRNA (adenosine(37)-N6)-threonylcarbamoyltransferase complex dimerization subunit type 1 TsaB [Candidatus Saccharibacteria bacterium TM7i]|nr:tRNA (adenosine(37)-N6)-threonylcarbamoyltransferase complex dimerization subunit type 1 TsaB [Candidatus Saccharibacteria bacterium TM7i]
MILLLDTSTPTCKLTLVEGAARHDFTWEAGRTLSTGLLGFIQERLGEVGSGWDALEGIVAYRGPGSFTGLRIGISVLNALANTNQLPIIGAMGEAWQMEGLARLGTGESDEIVLPEYGADANITTPRK